MQRTWKILSESSASSTDANRSSPSNSSDDSDCSTQTLHSMSTSMVASPPETASLSSRDSSSLPSREDSPIDPSSPLAGFRAPADEVHDKEKRIGNGSRPFLSTCNRFPPPLTKLGSINNDRDEKDNKNETRAFYSLSNEPSPPPPQIKTEPSNGEKNVKDKENEIRAFFSMSGENYVTTPELAKTTLQRLRQRLGGHSINNGSNSESAMRALELLRITIQSAFDKDIDVVIKRYMELYFKPAFSNIKENLGENAVSEEMLQKMSCALLENSKEQYNGLRLRQSQTLCATEQPTATVIAPVTQSTLTSTAPVTPTARAGLKRSAPFVANNIVNNTEMSGSGNGSTQKRAFSAISTRAQFAQTQNQLNAAERRANNIANESKTNTSMQQNSQKNAVQQQPPQTATATAPASSPTPLNNGTARRQIFWNTAHISTSTKFVLDVQANQAFGFGADGRERLASKHPELIRYLPDSDDRNWLLAQNIISQHNRNTRFLFLIYDEVTNLRSHEYYRNKPNVDLTVMRTFVVPEFIIQKMRHFFVDLNIKSRGLITNSFSMGITTIQNSSNNAQLNSNAAHPNSQLRTALLHGQAAQLQASLFNEETLMGCGSTTNDFVTTTTTLNESSSAGNGVNSTTNFFQPTRTSTLSSSHATLTALLNNTNPTGGPSLSASNTTNTNTTLKTIARNTRK